MLTMSLNCYCMVTGSSDFFVWMYGNEDIDQYNGATGGVQDLIRLPENLDCR